MHNSSPSRAPERAVLLSSINISIPRAAKHPGSSLRFAMILTSEESMQMGTASFICLQQKGERAMARTGRIWDRIAQSTELPGEALPGQSILEVLGDSRVLIEHHRGVQEYSRERIAVKLKFGRVCVCGCGLELTHMTKEQLVIRGRIDAVTLHRRG